MHRLTRALLLTLPLCLTTSMGYAQEHHFFTTSDGVKIHYVTAGETGSWVVLIHGFTDSAERMWVRTGIVGALSKNHRVVALDNRNHGQSDKPQPNGAGRPEDVIELMDHLKVDKAHIHGYSMGGGITGRLLALIPNRFITAGFGGSGISETDPALQKQATALDKPMPTPQGAEAAAFTRLREAVAARGAGAASASPPAPPPQAPIDLTSIRVPVIAINGEFDRPMSKTQRMWRELPIFQNVILPGKNHMSAIAVGGPMPQLYIDAMKGFIDTYDAR